MSKSKLTLSFVFNSVSYYVNQSQTYFAKKADTDTRITRISRANYEAAKAALDAELASIPTPAPVDPVTVAESVQASDPTPATPATVDHVPAPIEAAPVTVDPIVDAATRPDWDSMQTFERITMEDVQAVPALVARGLGFVAMGVLKVAAMGIGALAGLALMGLKKAEAR